MFDNPSKLVWRGGAAPVATGCTASSRGTRGDGAPEAAGTRFLPRGGTNTDPPGGRITGMERRAGETSWCSAARSVTPPGAWAVPVGREPPAAAGDDGTAIRPAPTARASRANRVRG